ncbi:MAG: signal recognition particle-docking protein FtsY [Deltaproteobacteria bacterium]|nr:signal recognition particle-docking protein FtsY [Deltaproteobacteria bacterium]
MDLPLLVLYGGLGLNALLALIYYLRLLRGPAFKEAKAPDLLIGLEKTRLGLGDQLKSLFSIQATLDPAFLEKLEETLLAADVGVKTTQKLLNHLQEALKENPQAQSLELLKAQMVQLLTFSEPKEDSSLKPWVTLVVGVNGVGKTTTVAKLAFRQQQAGKKLILAAADTFRAGAIEQLKTWGERLHLPVVAQKEGSDPAAVAFDAVQAGVARQLDQVLIDSAGRLHTKVGLMEELKKVKRVIQKACPGAPHEVLLVVDATQGQNALRQAEDFHEALGLTGLILTKMDSSSKGGMALALTQALQVPIHSLGLGEKLPDLQKFEAKAFVEALFA